MVIRLGVDDAAKDLVSCRAGVDGVSNDVIKIYAGVDGVSKLVWPSIYTGSVYYGVDILGFKVYAAVASVEVTAVSGMPLNSQLYAMLEEDTLLASIPGRVFKFYEKDVSADGLYEGPGGLLGRIVVNPSGVVPYLGLDTVLAGQYAWTLSSEKQTIRVGSSSVEVYSLFVETPHGAEYVYISASLGGAARVKPSAALPRYVFFLALYHSSEMGGGFPYAFITGNIGVLDEYYHNVTELIDQYSGLFCASNTVALRGVSSGIKGDRCIWINLLNCTSAEQTCFMSSGGSLFFQMRDEYSSEKYRAASYSIDDISTLWDQQDVALDIYAMWAEASDYYYYSSGSDGNIAPATYVQKCTIDPTVGGTVTVNVLDYALWESTKVLSTSFRDVAITLPSFK